MSGIFSLFMVVPYTDSCFLYIFSKASVKHSFNLVCPGTIYKSVLKLKYVFFLTGMAGALPFHYIRGKNYTKLLEAATGKDYSKEEKGGKS